MGVQIHSFLTNPQWNQMLDFVKQLGVTWVKVQVDWSSMETAKGQFSEQYSTLVQNLQRASAGNFRTMVSIAKAPDWSRPAGVRGQQDGPPDNPQDFVDFVARFIRDTKPVNIDAIEIWNEPNLIREWDGKPINGAQYMNYFNAVYPAIINEEKAQPDQFRPNHRITIVTAGPAPTSTTAQTLNDRVWIQQLYDNGLSKYGDDVAVGAHPYGWANSPDSVCCNAQPGVTGWYADPSFYFRNTIDDYRQIILKKNDPNRKLWVTEFGWASYDGLRTSSGGAANVNAGAAWESLLNQGQQANYVLRAFNLAQQPPYYDFMGPMVLWNLNYGIIPGLIDNGDEQAGFSLLDINWNPRPVFNMLKSAAKTTPTP